MHNVARWQFAGDQSPGPRYATRRTLRSRLCATTLGAMLALVSPAVAAHAEPGGADESAGTGETPRFFVSSVVLTDEQGMTVAPYPEEYDWTITATSSGTTYTSDEWAKAIVVQDPAPGEYALNVELNDAVAADTRFDRLQCSYAKLDGTAAELDVQYKRNGQWYVDVHPELTTACAYFYTVTGALPAPHFELVALDVLAASDERGDRLHVGDTTDWAAELVRDGASAASVAVGDNVTVAPGTYVPRLGASDSAQPGFDESVWRRSDWNCGGAGSTIAYGDQLRLDPGTTTSCTILVSDADVDLALTLGTAGDVKTEWDGVTGEVGTEFEVLIDVSNSMPLGLGGEVNDLRVVVVLPDNVEFTDPGFAPDGWTLESVEGRSYTYAATSALPNGGETVLALPAVITAKEVTSAVRACAITELIELDHDDNCGELVAVADGEEQPQQPEPEPEPNPEPEPKPEPEPEPEPNPEPEPQPQPEPDPEPEPEPTQAPEPKPEPLQQNKKLAQTGADSASVSVFAVGAGVLLLLGAGTLALRRFGTVSDTRGEHHD